MRQVSSKGFTLVELSIVLVIIGLLIGGILKGQELISNARIASTLQQIKSINAGVHGFVDAYRSLPGDLPQPDQKLPNCPPTSICGSTTAGTTGTGGSGTLADGAIGEIGVTNLGTEIPIGVGAAGAGTERAAAYVQLTAADFIGGINPNATNNNVFGEANIATSIPGGGFRIGYTIDGSGEYLTQDTNPDMRRGHYLELAADPTAAIDGDSMFLTGTQAARIDRKVDDGLPNLGLVRAVGQQGAGDADDCADGNASDSIYVESNTGGVCALYARVTG